MGACAHTNGSDVLGTELSRRYIACPRGPVPIERASNRHRTGMRSMCCHARMCLASRPREMDHRGREPYLGEGKRKFTHTGMRVLDQEARRAPFRLSRDHFLVVIALVYRRSRFLPFGDSHAPPPRSSPSPPFFFRLCACAAWPVHSVALKMENVACALGWEIPSSEVLYVRL